jgi:hypothetical protein
MAPKQILFAVVTLDNRYKKEIYQVNSICSTLDNAIAFVHENFEDFSGERCHINIITVNIDSYFDYEQYNHNLIKSYYVNDSLELSESSE